MVWDCKSRTIKPMVSSLLELTLSPDFQIRIRSVSNSDTMSLCSLSTIFFSIFVKISVVILTVFWYFQYSVGIFVQSWGFSWQDHGIFENSEWDHWSCLLVLLSCYVLPLLFDCRFCILDKSTVMQYGRLS